MRSFVEFRALGRHSGDVKSLPVGQKRISPIVATSPKIREAERAISGVPKKRVQFRFNTELRSRNSDLKISQWY